MARRLRSARPDRPHRVARVLLRLPADLHRTLTRAASSAGVSFNEWCVRRLAAPTSPGEVMPARTAAIARARDLLGAHLVGLVALGSWVRGEAGPHSDIDVLVVVDSETTLSRDLYRRWDDVPVVVEGRVIDAHFARLDPIDGPPTAAWAEAAVGGVVWHDPSGQIDRRLAALRRAIADGRLVRASVHGQPYWKGVA